MINFLEIVLDTTGIHPAKITTVDKAGKETSSIPRSEWKNGWNACLMDINNRAAHLEEWYTKKLTEQQKDAIEFFKDFGLSFYFYHKEDTETSEMKYIAREYLDPIVTLNCSDTFLWGCSDSEEITLDELVELQRASRWILKEGKELLNEISWLTIAFAAYKRGSLKLMDELQDEQERIDNLIEIIKTKTTIQPNPLENK